MLTAIGSAPASSSTTMSPHEVRSSPCRPCLDRSSSSGALANCGFGFAASFGALAPHATFAGDRRPGRPCSVDRGLARARSCVGLGPAAGVVVGAVAEHDEPDHDGDSPIPTPVSDRRRYAAALPRTAAALPARGELRQLPVPRALVPHRARSLRVRRHEGNQRHDAPAARRRARPGCRSRSPAPARSRTGASRDARTTAPATITSPRPRRHDGQGRALRMGHRAEPADQRSAVVRESQVRWMQVGVVAWQTQRHRLQRGRRCRRHATSVAAPPAGTPRRLLQDGPRPRPRSPRAPRRWAGLPHEALGEPDAPHLRADDPLGVTRSAPATSSVRAAADVEHRNGGGAAGTSAARPSTAPRNDSARLVLAGRGPRGRTRRARAPRRRKARADPRVPHGARGRDADPLRPEGPSAPAVAWRARRPFARAPPDRAVRWRRRPRRAG